MVNEFMIKKEICAIGKKIYDKGFAAANDGNISYRVGENQVLCTPTQICKGTMKPDDICMVDMSGKQTAGRKKRTSEVLLHLEIYKLDPQIKAVVHCHPPHATAFSIAGEEIPTCILPEVEVFLGRIPTAEYETPGAQNFADMIRPHVGKAKITVLKNHGTVSWAESLERAYWWAEILDAYCRMLVIAKQIGRVERISEPKVEELLDLKERFGLGVDNRRMENADLCINTEFGRGYCSSFGSNGGGINRPQPAQVPNASSGSVETEIEHAVQEITDRIMSAMG